MMLSFNKQLACMTVTGEFMKLCCKRTKEDKNGVNLLDLPDVLFHHIAAFLCDAKEHRSIFLLCRATSTDEFLTQYTRAIYYIRGVQNSAGWFGGRRGITPKTLDPAERPLLLKEGCRLFYSELTAHKRMLRPAQVAVILNFLVILDLMFNESHLKMLPKDMDVVLNASMGVLIFFILFETSFYMKKRQLETKGGMRHLLRSANELPITVYFCPPSTERLANEILEREKPMSFCTIL
jgi:hypothetical protein